MLTAEQLSNRREHIPQNKSPNTIFCVRALAVAPTYYLEVSTIALQSTSQAFASLVINLA